MENERGNFRRYPLWIFLDGSVSISFSMLLALLLNAGWCDGAPALGWLAEVTRRDNGVIIVATLLLFPCTLLLYGGLKMFFAAKEAVERRAFQRGQRAGIDQSINEGTDRGISRGRRQERARIAEILADEGTTVSPRLARYLADDRRDERDDD